MQQAWLLHINFYVEEGTADRYLVKGLDNDDKKRMYKDWKAVVDQAILQGGSLSLEDERIIISSLVLIVSDLMTDKVKEAKNLLPMAKKRHLYHYKKALLLLTDMQVLPCVL